MDTSRPLFTVVMPLFNKEAHLRETLASISAQAFDAFEVIVVDDGSTDDSVPVVEAWADARLRLVRQVNAGPGCARNRGVAEARGEWIAFIDADDLWHPDHLATLAETIAAYPAADVVASGFARALSLYEVVPTSAVGPREIDFFEEHDVVWTSAMAVRAAALHAESFGAVWPGEDVELWTRLALRHRFALHPRRTAIYVQHTGGAMDSQASAESFIPIADQPLFVTIGAALRDERWAPRHAAIARFRDRLMLEYTRPSLFNGQPALARAYLRTLRANGAHAPLAYRLLARVPGPLLRRSSRIYSAVKRRMRG